MYTILNASMCKCKANFDGNSRIIRKK